MYLFAILVFQNERVVQKPKLIHFSAFIFLCPATISWVSKLVTQQIYLIPSNIYFLNIGSKSWLNSLYYYKKQAIENSRHVKGAILTFISLLIFKTWKMLLTFILWIVIIPRNIFFFTMNERYWVKWGVWPRTTSDQQ